MNTKIITVNKIKTIALVAHDNRKADMVEWVEWNWEKLLKHKLICTGTTGRLVDEALTKMVGKNIDDHLQLSKLKSGPLGGDQQLGAHIAEGKIDVLIFFWDPMQAQPHDVDVKALLRIATVYNIPTATNRATADYMISSPLLDLEYIPKVKDYSKYINRSV
ncbi:MAG: methylglyoxal synthase [Bacteroidales bacterium]|nr:methylglyoxal synthase [Bacteroidales bacterium]